MHPGKGESAAARQNKKAGTEQGFLGPYRPLEKIAASFRS
jgi:hypothetical protein